jgi:hypothetical protein
MPVEVVAVLRLLVPDGAALARAAAALSAA